MIGAVEGDGLADIIIGRNHGKARMEARVPDLGQFAGKFRTRPVARTLVVALARVIGDDFR